MQCYHAKNHPMKNQGGAHMPHQKETFFRVHTKAHAFDFTKKSLSIKTFKLKFKETGSSAPGIDRATSVSGRFTWINHRKGGPITSEILSLNYRSDPGINLKLKVY